MSSNPLVAVCAVTKLYAAPRGPGRLSRKVTEPIVALDDVGLAIHRGRIMGLVGASGSGKSTLSEIVLGLVPPTSGSVEWNGADISAMDRSSHHQFRVNAQMVFQDPFGSLNPRMTVRQIVGEPAEAAGAKRAEVVERVGVALGRSELVADEGLLHRYPHQLSGGQLQRVAIARAIVMEPAFLAADEPVSMLDASVQSGVLNLLLRLRNELGLTILYVSHDLATVRYICDDIAVMNSGRIVERGSAADVLTNPTHAYTSELLEATPGRHRRSRARPQPVAL